MLRSEYAVKLESMTSQFHSFS